jgi:drug/metabolite transporter (DMT)-like permease
MRAADWLLLILLSILWGATFFFVAVALVALPPLTLVTARVALAALLLALIAGFRLPPTFRAVIDGRLIDWLVRRRVGTAR